MNYSTVRSILRDTGAVFAWIRSFWFGAARVCRAGILQLQRVTGYSAPSYSFVVIVTLLSHVSQRITSDRCAYLWRRYQRITTDICAYLWRRYQRITTDRCAYLWRRYQRITSDRCAYLWRRYQRITSDICAYLWRR